ncbi:hypothetical protein LPJ56_000807 [Coemansia sp. RSA 2599]|nr:hypothetical protein LPJ75_000397 [Coemansia sp. RSA 2598]KAJ1828875.1 hypothetical protein LPJ56_000807 [Coemansia sp. RSA 2599]
MTRLWSAARKHSYLVLSALAVVGLVGYLAYEVYQETAAESTDEPPSLPPAQDDDDQDDDAIEDVINIADELARSGSSVREEEEEEESLRRTATRAPSLPLGHQPRGRPMLTISARGIIFDSSDQQDQWSSRHLEVKPEAHEILWHLTAQYTLYLVVVARDEEDRDRVLGFLEDQRIVARDSTQTTPLSSMAESMVWVDRSDGEDGSRGSSISAPSSDISAILASPSVAEEMPSRIIGQPLDRHSVVFCQTEEGKAHLVRHLLTLPGSTQFTPAHASYAGYAGHVETNRDVVARLAPVLRKIVHVDGAIDCGEIPGANTAFSADNKASSGASTSSSAAQSTTRASVEKTRDITKSSIY